MKKYLLTDKKTIIFFSSLYHLLDAGLTISELLSTISSTNIKINRDISKKLLIKINSGESFSSAINQVLKLELRIYQLIKIGEESGNISSILKEIVKSLELKSKLKKSIINKLSYPLIILLTMFFFIQFFTFHVIPEYNSLYQELNLVLPKVTLIVIRISEFINKYIITCMLINLLLIFLFILLYKNQKIKYLVDKQILNIPLLGKIIKKVNLIRCFYEISMCLKSGIHLPNSINLTKGLIKNSALKKIFDEIQKNIYIGNSISYTISKSNEIPSIAQNLILIGEKSGKLDEILYQIATIFEDEVINLLKKLISLIEPILILILGSITAILVISLYLPIINIGNFI